MAEDLIGYHRRHAAMRATHSPEEIRALDAADDRRIRRTRLLIGLSVVLLLAGVMLALTPR